MGLSDFMIQSLLLWRYNSLYLSVMYLNARYHDVCKLVACMYLVTNSSRVKYMGRLILLVPMRIGTLEL